MPRTAPGRFPLVVFGLALLLAAHLFLLGFFKLTDFDTWFHLKQGELYVAARSLPPQDPFAFTTAGREWIKYSWLADVLFYLVFRAAGVPGLVLLRLLLLFLIVTLLYRIFRGCGLHPLASILLVFVASLALRFRLLIRPEILSFVFLPTNLAILLHLRQAPPRAAYLLLPLQVAWTNTHASFVFGIGLPGLVLLANFLPGDRPAPGWDRLRLDPPRRRHLAAAVALLPVAALLNPHGAAMLLFPFRQNTMERLTGFDEWKGIWFLPQLDPVWWEVVVVLILVVMAIAGTALFLWIRERRFDPVTWGIVLSMGIYAASRSRAIPYFVLAVLPLLALALVRVTEHLGTGQHHRSGPWLERAGVLGCLLVLIASIVDQAVFTQRSMLGFGVRPDLFPEAACIFLERHAIDGRVFNAYEFGGYLIWRRWPANQVLIDGRYDGVLFGEDLFEAFQTAYQSPAVFDRITALYNVDILLLSVQPGYRMAHLQTHPAWARVYWDPVAEIYVRRDARHAALIAAREYRLTGPDLDLRRLGDPQGNPETWRRALAELRRAVGDNPGNSLAWLGLAQAYRAAGPPARADLLEALDRAAALLRGGPVAAAVRVQRAETLLHLGRSDEAARAAREALRLDPGSLSARWFLAAAAEHRGAWAEARDELHAILRRLEPDHPEAPKIRARLEAAEHALRDAHGP